SHETYTVTGPAAGNFVLDPDGTPGNGDEETVSFTGLADTSDTKPATTFDVFLTAGSDLVQIADGSPAGTTRIVDLGSTFAGVTFGNKANVRVHGLGGSDFFTINPLSAATGLVSLAVFGNDGTGGNPDDNAADTFNVLATAAGVSTLVSGQGGN